MDPNATLDQIREYIDVFNRARDKNRIIAQETMHDFTERVEALDNWIAKGGFLPGLWIT